MKSLKIQSQIAPLIVCALLILAQTTAWAVELTPAEQLANTEARQIDGPSEVVRMNGLINDYKAGIIDEIDFITEIVEDDPSTVDSLFAYHGALTDCLLLDLLFAETNGVIANAENGAPIYFDTDQYLNEVGNVFVSYSKEFNTARRANKILQLANTAWEVNPCVGKKLSNHCCDDTAAPHECVPRDDYRCERNSLSDCIGDTINCPAP